MINKNECIIQELATSFVYADMKPVSETGNGESKLFLGSTKETEEFRKFFDFDNHYIFKLDKQNLLDYMNQVKFEYHFQLFNKYNNANLQEWNEKYELLSNLEEDDLYLNLIEQTDKSRYYLAQKPREGVEKDKQTLKNILRRCIVPKISSLIFKKSVAQHTISVLLNVDFSKLKLN